MSDRQVALLRGINVGRAKRVAMADLRAVFRELGFEDINTLLNTPRGILASRLPEAAGRLLGDAVTTRNWSTITKIQALVNQK